MQSGILLLPSSSEVMREPSPKRIKQGPESIEKSVSWTLPMPIPGLLGSQTPDGPSGYDTGISMPVWKSCEEQHL